VTQNWYDGVESWILCTMDAVMGGSILFFSLLDTPCIIIPWTPKIRWPHQTFQKTFLNKMPEGHGLFFVANERKLVSFP